MAIIDILSLLVGIAGLLDARLQHRKAARIEERNYHDTLNTAITAQKALAYADDTERALDASPVNAIQQLDPQFAKCVEAARISIADVVTHCGIILAITHKEQLVKNWDRLKGLAVVHGQLRKAIEANLSIPLPPIKILSPAHGKQVSQAETVKVKSDSPNPVRFFVFNDGNWHSQDAPKRIDSSGEWVGQCHFGADASESGKKFKLAAVATGVETEWKIKELPTGQNAEIEVIRK